MRNVAFGFTLQCTTETRNMIFFNFFWYSFWRVLYQINIFKKVPLGDGGIGRIEDENETAGGGWGVDIPGSKNTDERAYYWQSHPLWARQREGNKEQDNAWKRESQSEREASKPLKKAWGWHLHVHLLTLNIPPVSVSLGDSPCFLWCVTWFCCFCEKMPFFDSPTVKSFDGPGGKTYQKKLKFLTWKGQADMTHSDSTLPRITFFMNLNMIILA